MIRWLTGYRQTKLEGMQENKIPYGDFFRNAPKLNENRKLIKGVVCGIRVEDIREPLMQEIRYLDKLVHRCTNSRVNSTRYPRHLHACEASRRPHYAVASQTHS